MTTESELIALAGKLTKAQRKALFLLPLEGRSVRVISELGLVALWEGESCEITPLGRRLREFLNTSATRAAAQVSA